MNKKFQKIIKPLIVIAAFVFAVCCVIRKPAEFEDYTSYIGYSVTVVTVLFVLYEKWLWKITPWNRFPVLSKEYDGVIKYTYNGVTAEKPIQISIKQSWLSIEVTTKTDINSSITTSAIIVNEYGQDVLYYTYLTNPSAATREDNPIQHGATRMLLNRDNKVINGIYWTTSHTTGDMEWKAK